MNSEAGNEIAIPIPTTTQETQSNEYQTARVGDTGILSVNTEAGMEIAIPVVGDAAATPTTTTEAEDDRPLETQVNEYRHTAEGTENTDHKAARYKKYNAAMYKAATEGDWAKAETLLEIDTLLGIDMNLGWVEISKDGEPSEDGDRALHLAVSREHTEFVRKLIEKVGWEMLELYDGKGYTACHYAVMDGNVELVAIMIEANPFVAYVQNWYGTTPFTLAISYGNAEIVSYFLNDAKFEHFEDEECFNILLVAINNNMLDAALIILQNKVNLALMQDDDGRTALHFLAQLDITTGDRRKRQADLRQFTELAAKLWDNIQNLGKTRVLHLMKNPPILHDAAKVGNVDLINMIAFDYPDLLSHYDQEEGCSMFHIVVTHRKKNTLELVSKAKNVKNFNELSQDKDGNNLLHSAGKSIRPKGLEITAEPDAQMQRAFAWFKDVEANVPPFYLKMRNKKGYTPEELFWKEHKKLLATSQTYMKSTAESCMLISTIVLTLVFAAAFAPPSGFSQETGIPVLLKKKWFACFIIFQVLALSSSTLSIIGFWSIISSNYEEHQFFALPRYLRLSMCALLLSVLFVISAFLSAFFLIFVEEREALVVSFMLPLYLVLVVGILYQLFKVLRKNYRLQRYARMGGKIKKVH